jgi:A/G-specific adenine glycosylase
MQLVSRRLASAIRRKLHDWFATARRAMPWRASRDPYGIWLSEVMLQQTTVATVTPRWRRFIDRWPTIADLAAAPLDDVLAEWTGLGYYQRARNLHRAARVVVAHHGAQLPPDYTALLALPGMGEYTAAAVASIAFGQPVPLIDANVERVLARLFALRDPIRSAPARRHLRALAAQLVDPDRPGDFNQALMELGSLLCLPRTPKCEACPLARECVARAEGTPTAYPVLPAKAPIQNVNEAGILLRRGLRFYLVRRGDEGSFSGMWETPRVTCEPGEDSAPAALRAAREHLGIEGTNPCLVFRARHTVMRTRINLAVYTLTARGGTPNPRHHVEGGWFTLNEWKSLPKSSTQEKLRRALAGEQPKAELSPAENPSDDLFGTKD